MANTDVKLLADQIRVEGQRQVIVDALDLCVDSPVRRSEHNSPDRRALVHDNQDALTVNYDFDYPGGVTINGLKSINSRKPHTLTSPHAIDLTIQGGAKIVGNLVVEGIVDSNLTVKGKVLFHGKSAPGSAIAVPPGQPPPPPAPPLDLAEVIFTLQQEVAALKKKVGL